MRHLRRLRGISNLNAVLLLRAALLVAGIRVALWLLPFSCWRRLALASWPLHASQEPDSSVDRLAWAVSRVSRFIPGATCLTQALALMRLLLRSGRLATLHVGVAKSADGRFEAHAWVDSGGKTVIGGSAIEHYVPLLQWGKPSS